jgi:hypothetical protein
LSQGCLRPHFGAKRMSSHGARKAAGEGGDQSTLTRCRSRNWGGAPYTARRPQTPASCRSSPRAFGPCTSDAVLAHNVGVAGMPMWLLPRSSMFELGHDRRKSYRAANGSFASNSPVAACFGERPESALCSLWPMTRRMGDNAPIRPLPDRRANGPVGWIAQNAPVRKALSSKSSGLCVKYFTLRNRQ